MVLVLRSDSVHAIRTDYRPPATCWSSSRATRASPLHRQIESSIRDGIRAGRLLRGTALPPTRGLAAELGVSRGVVVEAYQQLVAEGYLASRAGGYTRVAIGPEALGRAAPRAACARARIDFCPCRADGSMFPRAAWLRSMRRALAEARATSATPAAAACRRCTRRSPPT